MSLGHFLLGLLLVGLGSAQQSTPVNDPCKPTNPCPQGHYCLSPPEEENPYQCIQTGYLYGNCSLNTLETCAPNTKCIEKADRKSYTCECENELAEGNGIRKDKGGTGCILPYTECKKDKECSQYGTCDASVGYCKCNEGFKGDGVNCTDIIDCPSPACDENAICKDIPGNFTCTCDGKRNYVGDGYNCKHVCRSDNDCDHPRGRCNKDADCECRPGYSGNGRNCVDINECTTNAHDCPGGAYCINSPGGYDCKCLNGYFGDGRNCKQLPKNCKEVPNMVNGAIVLIDPDGTGPADQFDVVCDTLFGEIVTKLMPKGAFPMEARTKDTELEIPYDAKPEDIRPLLEKSGFCFQDIKFDCFRHHSFFPGTKWYDAYGNENENWGTDENQKCACGVLGTCNRCNCDGNVANKWVVTDDGKLVDKNHLPLMKMVFKNTNWMKGKLLVGPLICMDTTAAIPKNCHDAKFNHKILKDGPLYIDVDGKGPIKPFIAQCDMSSYDNVGITIMPPNSPVINITTIEGESVDYRVAGDKMKGLIQGSVYCEQKVEFKCQHSSLMGNGGGYVSVGSEKRKLNYFPGANGVQDACGCGATKSCNSPTVKCNCNIDDDNVKKDFGLIINKNDLPVVHLNAEYGGDKTSTYTVGPLRCAGNQFGIEPNCEKYRATGVRENYSYFIDPDGVGNLEPYLAECKFMKSPPQGLTIIHHEVEIEVSLSAQPFDLKYLDVSNPQIDALKDRSTYCSQEVKVGCQNLLLKESDDIIEWQPSNITSMLSLLGFMETCTDGNGCNCQGSQTTSDSGEIFDKGYLPIDKISVAKILSQIQGGAKASVTVGPLICSEVFPSCAALKSFINSAGALEGEADVINGLFTIDPDGAGGVEPFEVICQFPKTIVPLTPGTGTIKPNETAPEEPVEGCVKVQYQDEKGNPISPEQITALVKASGNCRQQMSLECQMAPATGNINFTTCDGKTQKGWAGSMGEDKCACGVHGICDGGTDAKCNCDVGDERLRQDKGMIFDNDRLPICEACMSVPGLPADAKPDAPTPMHKVQIGSLICDGSTGLGKSCQAARKSDGFSGEPQNVPTFLNIANTEVGVACKYFGNPPVGAMVLNPRDPVYPPPDPESPVNVTIKYITIRIDLVKIALRRNVYCRQKIFFFCVGSQPIETGGVNGYYDDEGNVYHDWVKMDGNGEDVTNACNQYKDLCDKCGKPDGYLIVHKSQIPVASIYMGMKGVTVVVDHVECLNMRKSCQELMDLNQLWYAKVGYSTFLLDPDGPLPGLPFVASCKFYQAYKTGITIIPLGGQWEGKVNVQGKNQPGEFEIPVEYDDVSVDQARSLAKISDFCWQNIKYECKYSPLLNNGQNPASYYYLNSTSPATSFGTDDKIDATGCACGVLGTCTTDDVTCNCDAKGPMGVDQGAITDKDVLPLVQVNVGGQTAQSNVDITLSPLQCGKLPVPPPRDCQDGLKKEEENTIEYKNSGEFLISPNPRTVAPFMAYCDFDLLPGKGVTVIKPKVPPSDPVDDPKTPVDVPYGGPDPEQIRALVAFSKYCYQGVKFECQSTEFLEDDAYWLTAGSTTKNHFWGGGEPKRANSGVCACGKTGNCGGLDSYMGQRNRKCNCDYADGTKRMDAGIITMKEYLPISQFTFGQNSKFGKANFTFGDLICSQYPIPMNECELGFYDCHPLATCKDMEDGYQCICPKGYQGKTTKNLPNAPRANGRECIDDDECSWNPCSHTANCHNTPGSFYCTCKPGFRRKDALSCVDINECEENTDECHENARCENLFGSYRCACKKGYRGNGKTSCRAVGECKCFGDPHCLSFDSRWLHYQGLCEYVMSKDNCDSDEPPTYQVLAKYWRRGSNKPGYYSYVQSVRILLGDLEIKLDQNRNILVNGIYMASYANPDGVSALKYPNEVIVRSPNGLEVTWDGKDSVTVVVPEDRKTKTCGICGNYNQNPKDDWIVGEECEGKKGNVTDNFALFGNSWTVTNNSEIQCTPDCDPEVPPDPRDCKLKDLIEYECGRLLNRNTSPFKDCLALMSDEDVQQFSMSCSYDLCFVELDFQGAVCDIAENLNVECTKKYKTRITTWRAEVEYCEKKECANNMIYKTCGNITQPTCMSDRVPITIEDNVDECFEGCFCEEGLVMDEEKCIPKDDCGCLYNNQYIQKGDLIVNKDCQTQVKCEGGDKTTTSPVKCEENQECRVADTGKPGCYCVEGYLMNNITGECIKDPCYNVSCPLNNTACVQGQCECAMGFIGDCNTCANIDECATGLSNCNMIGHQCTDLPGSFKCECQDGFIPQKDGSCKDIDECEIFTDKCGANAECANTLGGYRCECCAGYKKNSEGTCIRDTSQKKASKCCACNDEKCTRPGKVCGKDAVTYNDFRSLAISACRDNKENKVDYPGPCQGTCETVVCKIPYQNCSISASGKPSCSCPTCQDSTFEAEYETICATNKVTYTSICHMKAATCEAELEVQVEVETKGKPCGEGPPLDKPGPWSDWTDCSETCKQGEMSRTREVGNSGRHAKETIPCFSTCVEGPCTINTCDKPGQVCSADVSNVTNCECPICDDFPKDPVCGRLGVVIQTYENQCELDAEACANNIEDYEVLEPRACEDKPIECGKIRKFTHVIDKNGCRADRTINVASCYGGCDKTGEKCCYPTKKSEQNLIMSCPNGTFYRKQETIIDECNCIDQSLADELKEKEEMNMQTVG